MKSNGRDMQGRFVLGNPGGPGRPSRPVEREYLSTLLDVCTLEKWRLVCEKRLAQALEGDAGAVAWLEKYLFGSWRLSLSELWTRERMGITAAAELEFEARKQSTPVHQQSITEIMAADFMTNDEGGDVKGYLLQIAEFAQAEMAKQNAQ